VVIFYKNLSNDYMAQPSRSLIYCLTYHGHILIFHIIINLLFSNNVIYGLSVRENNFFRPQTL
jgi:hypothetical protein